MGAVSWSGPSQRGREWSWEGSGKHLRELERLRRDLVALQNPLAGAGNQEGTGSAPRGQQGMALSRTRAGSGRILGTFLHGKNDGFGVPILGVSQELLEVALGALGWDQK